MILIMHDRDFHTFKIYTNLFGVNNCPLTRVVIVGVRVQVTGRHSYQTLGNSILMRQVVDWRQCLTLECGGRMEFSMSQ